jgi:hypothetical protein
MKGSWISPRSLTAYELQQAQIQRVPVQNTTRGFPSCRSVLFRPGLVKTPFGDLGSGFFFEWI